jgi:hypothetical protein
MLHEISRDATPGHIVPPGCGAGLVQVRVWVSVPPPQVAVHWVAFTHADQLPSPAKHKH